MEQARLLRAKADHCIRLSHGINNPADVYLFETLAADFIRAAIEQEATKAARLADRPARPV
jgi:hypothetical protein